MKKYSILVLTDHRTHSPHESLYPIVHELHRNQKIEKLFIASIGDEKNLGIPEENLGLVYGTSDIESYTFDNKENLFEKTYLIEPNSFQVVLIRIDGVLSQSFLVGLENFFRGKVCINNPLTAWETTSKKFLLRYPTLVPGVELIKSVDQVRAAVDKYGEVVLKPLEEHGGQGLMRLNDKIGYYENHSMTSEKLLIMIEDILSEQELILMKYLRGVANGDNRIVIVNGVILGSVVRIPPSNSWLCNSDQGGIVNYSKPTKEEIEICNIVCPDLIEKGQVIVGLDTIEDHDGKRVLSEINTVNTGGIKEISDHDGELYLKLTDSLVNYIDHKVSNSENIEEAKLITPIN